MSEDGEREPAPGSSGTAHREPPGAGQARQNAGGESPPGDGQDHIGTPRADALIPALDQGQLAAQREIGREWDRASAGRQVWRQALPTDPFLGEYPEASEVHPGPFTRFVPVAGRDGQLPPIQAPQDLMEVVAHHRPDLAGERCSEHADARRARDLAGRETGRVVGDGPGHGRFVLDPPGVRSGQRCCQLAQRVQATRRAADHHHITRFHDPPLPGLRPGVLRARLQFGMVDHAELLTVRITHDDKVRARADRATLLPG
jgi:hypothetical protein